jgi:SnoaL-like protein
VGPISSADPKQFIYDFFSSYGRDLLRGDEDASVVVDRYHTPDIVQIADGQRMNREQLIAHGRPLRKRQPSSRMEVHEAVAGGDRIAARYTLHVEDRRRSFAIDVYLFGQFAPDGRMRRAHMLTRTLPDGADRP